MAGDKVDIERGHRITALMDATGVSNTDLAAACAVSSSTVTLWRTGREIKTKYLATIAKALGTTIDHMIAGESDPTPGEVDMIRKMRQINPEIRDAIICFIEKLPAE